MPKLALVERLFSEAFEKAQVYIQTEKGLMLEFDEKFARWLKGNTARGNYPFLAGKIAGSRFIVLNFCGEIYVEEVDQGVLDKVILALGQVGYTKSFDSHYDLSPRDGTKQAFRITSVKLMRMVLNDLRKQMREYTVPTKKSEAAKKELPKTTARKIKTRNVMQPRTLTLDQVMSKVKDLFGDTELRNKMYATGRESLLMFRFAFLMKAYDRDPLVNKMETLLLNDDAALDPSSPTGIRYESLASREELIRRLTEINLRLNHRFASFAKHDGYRDLAQEFKEFVKSLEQRWDRMFHEKIEEASQTESPYLDE